MKKFHVSLLIVIGMMLLISCNADDLDNVGIDKHNTTTLVAFAGDESGTRTALDNNGVSVNWIDGDAISVFDLNGNNNPFTLSSGAGTNCGYFNGTTEVQGAKLAIYPYSTNYTITGVNTANGQPVSETNLPTSITLRYGVVSMNQTAVKDGFDPRYNIMTALSFDDKLYFKQAVCYVEIETTKPCYAIIFIANGGESIKGKLDITVSTDGTSTCSCYESGGSEITLSMPNNEIIEPGVYHIAIIPQTLTKGFTVKCPSTEGKIMTRAYTKKTTAFNRDKIISIGKTEGWDEEEHVCDHYYEYGAGCKDMVDLGLPSGLKWAKCNLGADMELESGDFYAWGAVEPWIQSYDIDKGHSPKITITRFPSDNPNPVFSCKWHPDHKAYDLANTPYYNTSTGKWTKYAFNNISMRDPGASDTDLNLTRLTLSDDAAHYQWGGNWRMPTCADYIELVENTNLSKIPNYNNTTITAFKFTSKVNPNNYIIIPMAGYFNNATQWSFTELYYWASENRWNGTGWSLSDMSRANRFTSNGWDSKKDYVNASSSKNIGMPIRAVWEEPEGSF